MSDAAAGVRLDPEEAAALQDAPRRRFAATVAHTETAAKSGTLIWELGFHLALSVFQTPMLALAVLMGPGETVMIIPLYQIWFLLGWAVH